MLIARKWTYARQGGRRYVLVEIVGSAENWNITGEGDVVLHHTRVRPSIG
jgi:hypothetical protein